MLELTYYYLIIDYFFRFYQLKNLHGSYRMIWVGTLITQSYKDILLAYLSIDGRRVITDLLS